MWDILSARPAFSTAATESPPPMMVTQPFSVSSASVSQMANVPLANASISKTPMGPFQMTVLQSASFSWISFVALGPLSRPIQPSGMESWSTTCVLASASNLSATRISEGKMSSQPFSSASFMAALAVSRKSSSTRDEPTGLPMALRNVKVMPPPMMTLSHLLMRDSRTVIFEDTLEPPTMAARGRTGSSTAPARYLSSLARR
mmetsp:Transcript_20530/g.67809  ORF Transcript_20530/g.67809 Transcript_20530/m.67809 type:complete len:203 (+) Transcript_20530:231-839(+)